MKIKNIIFILFMSFIFLNKNIYAKQNTFTTSFTETFYDEIDPNEVTIYYSIFNKNIDLNKGLEENKKIENKSDDLLVKHGIKKEDIKNISFTGNLNVVDGKTHKTIEPTYYLNTEKSAVLTNVNDLENIINIMKSNDLYINVLNFNNNNLDKYYNEQLNNAIKSVNTKAEITSNKTNKKLKLFKISEENSVLKEENIIMEPKYNNDNTIFIPKIPVEAKIIAEYTY